MLDTIDWTNPNRGAPLLFRTPKKISLPITYNSERGCSGYGGGIWCDNDCVSPQSMKMVVVALVMILW